MLFCFVDHYEPKWGEHDYARECARVARWRTDYPALCANHRDADGLPPVHSFFYPEEEYRPEHLDALVELSDRLDVEERNPLLDHDDAQRYGIEWAPSIVPLWLDDEGQPHDSRLRIVGMPTGFEFVALIKAITVAGGSPLTLSPNSQRAAADVREPLTLTVFSTPSCPHCPGAAALAFELAAAGRYAEAQPLYDWSATLRRDGRELHRNRPARFRAIAIPITE